MNLGFSEKPEKNPQIIISHNYIKHWDSKIE